MIQAEARLHEQVCQYLRVQYPGVLFRTDFAAGIKMTMGQAARHKKLQSGRAWPDLAIYEPRHGFFALFLELKAATIYKRNGELLSNPHVEEQQDMLKLLRSKGYQAQFAVGFDQAKELIDGYLVQ